MEWRSFETIVTGKWILAGEHSVLRGVPALVFPFQGRSLHFIFFAESKQNTLELELIGERGDEMRLPFWGVLERACELAKISRSGIHGKIKISSDVPVGAGLGASATLCAAIARWFVFENIIRPDQAYEFAKSLENLFHGESSGVDIAVALGGEPIKFYKDGAREHLQMNWKPKWYLSYSGKRGVTLDCVNKVKALIEKNPELGKQLDQQMKNAVSMAEVALSKSSDLGLPHLVQSMKLAAECFERWGLAGGEVKEHMDHLYKQGALAVKPTGSGDGGYILSLWRQTPPQELELIPC